MSAELTVRTIADAWRDAHEKIRAVLRDVGDDALDWAPTARENSIAVLVTHTCGSEAEVIASVLGTAVGRDRDAEFRVRGSTRDALLRLLDAADERVSSLAARAGGIELARMARRANDPVERTAVQRLVTNYGHTREHLAHIELTAQLWRASAPAGGGPAPRP